MSTLQTKKQNGFTLVELAVVMVIIGLLLGAILKGQDLIDNARGKRVMSDMKAMEALLWTYYDRQGSFPGDCDGDGLMGADISVASSPLADAADALDAAAVDPTLALNCAAAGADDINTPLADLRTEHLLAWEKLNVNLGLHSGNGTMLTGQVLHSVSTTQRNAIILFDIPQWMGEMIDANVDGTLNGTTGRIRYFNTLDQGAAWPAKSATPPQVAILYLFDKSF